MTDFLDIPLDFIYRNLSATQKRTLKRKYYIRSVIDHHQGDGDVYRQVAHAIGSTVGAVTVQAHHIKGETCLLVVKDAVRWIRGRSFNLSLQFIHDNFTAYQRNSIEIKRHIQQAMEANTGLNKDLFYDLAEELNLSYGSIHTYAYTKIK